MAKINRDIQSFARIKVIGVGGSGKNALNHMIEAKVDGVEFICFKRATQDLHHSKANKKNPYWTKPLPRVKGTGMSPVIGREASCGNKG
jgi:cell division protein FtsZ